MLWLFNPQFQQAYPVMVILAIGLLTRAALGPADVVLNMLGQGTASALLPLASALLSVVLSAALVPALGFGRRRRGDEPCPRCRGGRQLRARQTAAQP